MANVLATLFSDIANAIRNKTGNTDKMSPKDFPTQIESISVGGGGGGDTSSWKFASGKATGNGGTVTITHGLGSVPDIIYVSAGGTAGEVRYVGGLGFSGALTEAINGNGDSSERGVQFVDSVIGPIQVGLKEGVEGAHSEFSGMYGVIRNANTSTFQVGGGEVTPIPNGVNISWWAVSGIT